MSTRPDCLNYPDAILGLDPGRDKIGFAFASMSGDLFCSGIIMAKREGKNLLGDWPRFLELLESQALLQEHCYSAGLVVNLNDFAPWVSELPVTAHCEPPEKICVATIALGNGTCSDTFEKELRTRELSGDVELTIIDEHGTTLEARNLYWRLHRPSLLKRLLPRSMWGSSRPLDDLAAWAIARRSLEVNQ